MVGGKDLPLGSGARRPAGSPGIRETMLRIDPGALEALRRDGQARYPEECCGILLGRGGAASHAREALLCDNADAEPRLRYAVGDRDLLRAVKRARERGEEIVGFYHSHPDGPARPSAADLDDAWWPDCSYVITSVAGGRAGETRAFRLREEAGERRFEPEPLEEAP